MIYEIPFSSLRPGLKLQADGGFTCLKAGEIVTVEEASDPQYPEDGFCIRCREGEHNLCGQIDYRRDRTTIVGFIIAEDQT